MAARRVLALLCLFWMVLAAVRADCAHEKPRLALVLHSHGPTFIEAVARGARLQAAESLAEIEFIESDPAAGTKAQAALIDRLVEQKVAAIIIDSLDVKPLLGSLVRAKASGVQLVVINSPVDADSSANQNLLIPVVVQNYFAAASQIGGYVADKLGHKGRAVVLDSPHEHACMGKALQGFSTSLAKGGLGVSIEELRSATQDETLARTAKLLSAHPRPEAIVCISDQLALWVAQAVEQAGLSGKIMVTGFGNTPAVREQLATGRVQATVDVHDEYLGGEAVRLAMAGLAGHVSASRMPLLVDLITSDTFGKKLFFAVSELSNPFFSSLTAAIRSQSELHGMTLQLSDASGDEFVQLVGLRKAANDSCDVMLVNAVDTQTALPGMDYAARRGIPLFTLDRGVFGVPVVTHISSDNEAGGRLAGEFLISATAGKARCLMLEGSPGLTATHDRAAGFLKAVEGYKDFDISTRVTAGFDRIKAREVVFKILRQSGGFDAIFAHNDAMALGALDAIKQAKLKSMPLVVGFDGTAEAQADLQSGDMAAVVVQQTDRLAVATVNAVAEFLRGRKVQSRITLPVSLLTWGRS